MSRTLTFVLFFLAVFLQAGAYGLTFMLPRLFDMFGASEKTVGAMLFLTTIVTLITVYFSGHLSDIIGRLRTLGVACLAIAAALFLFGSATAVNTPLAAANILLGFGWGLTYSLAPIVLTRLVTPSERVSTFALLSVFVMAGFGLAPVLASLLENNGLSIRSSFYITAAASLISAVLFFALTIPVRQHALSKGPEAASRISLQSLRQVLTSPARIPVIMGCLGASVFAGMSNFQTTFADARGLDYGAFFLTYATTVIVFRLILVRFTGGANPYRTIAILQFIMCVSVLLFLISGDSAALYITVAFLFGIGYGVSYPILVAMAATDANEDLGPQTLQLFALSYFIGVFGFPLIAGWMIVELGTPTLLITVAILAALEATLALRRAYPPTQAAGGPNT